MSVVKYNKLVRDNVPQIIKESGKTCQYIVMDDSVMSMHLFTKLHEEFNEFIEAVDSKNEHRMLEELADMTTVINSIVERLNCEDEFDKIKTFKDLERGKFRDNIFLVDVTDLS